MYIPLLYAHSLSYSVDQTPVSLQMPCPAPHVHVSIPEYWQKCAKKTVQLQLYHQYVTSRNHAFSCCYLHIGMCMHTELDSLSKSSDDDKGIGV